MVNSILQSSFKISFRIFLHPTAIAKTLEMQYVSCERSKESHQ